MLHLANAELTVDLLDPVAEHAHLGPRFCWGGYIWQIHDQHVGDLLTGPEWPKPDPVPRNGQGLPESFRHSTMTGQPLLWDRAAVRWLAGRHFARRHATRGKYRL